MAGHTATMFATMGVASKGCMVGMAITHPADAVVIPRNEYVALIQFRERIAVDSCPLSQWHVRSSGAVIGTCASPGKTTPISSVFRAIALDAVQLPPLVVVPPACSAK